jgi:transposase-like protein
MEPAIVPLQALEIIFCESLLPGCGIQHLWRAVDQDGDVVDVFLQSKWDGAAAKRFFKRLLRNHGDEPRKIVTDKLRSYGVAHRELIPDVIHSTEQYENNRAEQSHEPTRVREWRLLEVARSELFRFRLLTCQYLRDNDESKRFCHFSSPRAVKFSCPTRLYVA